MKEKLKNYWYVVLIVLSLIIIYLIANNSVESEIQVQNIEQNIKKEEIDIIDDVITNYFVDIKGEVVKPGVYEISSNSRVIDVINKAGGLTKNADTSILNLSKKVTDEMSIKIYSKKEINALKEKIKKEPEIIEIIKEIEIEKECICKEINDSCYNDNDALINKENTNIIENDKENIDKNENTETKLININTATKEELTNIPNIGESKAQNIIDYRSKNKFEKLEDILNVTGIGETLFEKIKEYITV